MIDDEDDLPVLHEVVRSGNARSLRATRVTAGRLSGYQRPAHTESVHFDLPAHLLYNTSEISTVDAVQLDAPGLASPVEESPRVDTAAFAAAMAEQPLTGAETEQRRRGAEQASSDRLQFDLGLDELGAIGRSTSRFASIDAESRNETGTTDRYAQNPPNHEADLDLDDTLDLSSEAVADTSLRLRSATVPAGSAASNGFNQQHEWHQEADETRDEATVEASWEDALIDNWAEFDDEFVDQAERDEVQTLDGSFDLQDAIGFSSVSTPPNVVDDELEELIDELIDRHIISLRKDIRRLLQRSQELRQEL